MKIEKTSSSIDIEFKNGTMIGLWECLSEVIFNKRYNWNTWQFINIEFENDRAMQAYEFTFVFLCCGFRIRIPTNPKKEHKIHAEVKKNMDTLLHRSCHGWCNAKEYKMFKNKEVKILMVTSIRTTTNRKKLFIQ